MLGQELRGWMMTLGVGAILLGAPAASNACCFLDSLFGCGRTTYYQPVAAAPACAPCAPCGQTCQYTPQTYFRTYYRPVPVLAYRPVAACDPCGGATTAYQPVRSWGYQACLVPYTTYRVGYSVPCATGCAPCMTGCSSLSGCSSCGSYGATTYGAPASGCSSCGAPAASTTLTPTPMPRADDMSAPSINSPASPAPGTTYEGGAAGPGLRNGNGAAPGTVITPAPVNSATQPGAAAPESRVRSPIQPEQSSQRPIVPGVPARDNGLRYNIQVPPQPPETPNRVTSRPVQQAAHYQLIAAPKAAPAYSPEGLDDSGWRQSHD
jgi:hypothetical protein